MAPLYKGSCPRSGLRGRLLPAHAAPTGGNPRSPTRAATPLPPPRRSLFQALRILWAQPEQRAYLYTLTEHLKEYEWL